MSAGTLAGRERGLGPGLDAGPEPGPGPGLEGESALAIVAAALDRLVAEPPVTGRLRVLAVTGDPGTGKSQLLAEAGRLAAERGLPVLTGRVHDTVRTMLEELAAPGLTILVDDVHRADEHLVDVLLDLLERPPGARALIVLAYSPRLGAARLHQAVVGGGCPCPVQWLPLASPRVAALLQPSRQAATPGSTAAGRKTSAPRVLAQARYAVEFAALPAPMRTVGWAAAVVGRAFDVTLLAVVAELAVPDTVGAVDELVRHGMVRPVAGTGRFAFRDRDTWQATYSGADPAWRVSAHARAVAALRDKGAGPTTLAPHLEFAATLGDQEAVSVLTAAARAARATAPLVCARWLRAALRLLPQHAFSTPACARLQVELADALADAGLLVDSRDLLHRVLETVERDAPELGGFVTARCARIERLLCHQEEGRALLLRAVSARTPAGRAPDDEAQQLCAYELALAELVDGRLEDSRRWITVALAAPDRRETRPRKAATLGLAGLIETLSGQPTGGTELTDASARLVDGLTDSEVRRLPQAAGLLGWSELVLGRGGDALRHLDRAIGAARTSGNVLVLPDLLAARSLVLRDAGRLTEAADVALSAAELASVSGSDQQLVLALAARCSAATWLGEHRLALRTGDTATARRERPASRWVRAFALRVHAEARVAAGELDAGAELVEALGGPELAGADPWSRLHAYELLTRIATTAGDLEAAERWAAQAEATQQSSRSQQAGSPQRAGGGLIVLPGRVGIARLARAQALSLTDPGAARDQALAAAASLDPAGLPLDAARARLVAGRAAGFLGHADEAATHLRQAQAVFEAHGARRWSRLAVAERRRLAGAAPRSVRPRSEPAARSVLGRLTRREQQVAALVSQGLSNRRVAQQLYIAEKTVEMHLSNIFAKLSVGSRTEMARIVMTG